MGTVDKECSTPAMTADTFRSTSKQKHRTFSTSPEFDTLLKFTCSVGPSATKEQQHVCDCTRSIRGDDRALRLLVLCIYNNFLAFASTYFRKIRPPSCMLLEQKYFQFLLSEPRRVALSVWWLVTIRNVCMWRPLQRKSYEFQFIKR